MTISLIVAVAENNVIGKNNALPWYLPADMKHFRDTTMGHCVIMGRKNYDSIPLKYRPLDERTNIVVTHQKDFKAERCIVVNSLEDALSECKKKNESEVFIIGGAQIYKLAMPVADKLYVTHIHHTFEGDTFFPAIDANRWKLTKQKNIPADEKNKFAGSVCIYEKKNK
ncbi:MAG: dihydrofolate reductase [Bacteroidota bacterium]